MEKTNFHVVLFSGGKDSTAMLLRMIEEEMPIDGIAADEEKRLARKNNCNPNHVHPLVE